MPKIFKSRKFWLTVYALIQTVVGHYLTIPTEIIVAADALVVVLISSIAYEDGERAKAQAAADTLFSTQSGARYGEEPPKSDTPGTFRRVGGDGG